MCAEAEPNMLILAIYSVLPFRGGKRAEAKARGNSAQSNKIKNFGGVCHEEKQNRQVFDLHPAGSGHEHHLRAALPHVHLLYPPPGGHGPGGPGRGLRQTAQCLRYRQRDSVSARRLDRRQIQPQEAAGLLHDQHWHPGPVGGHLAQLLHAYAHPRAVGGHHRAHLLVLLRQVRQPAGRRR